MVQLLVSWVCDNCEQAVKEVKVEHSAEQVTEEPSAEEVEWWFAGVDTWPVITMYEMQRFITAFHRANKHCRIDLQSVKRPTDILYRASLIWNGRLHFSVCGTNKDTTWRSFAMDLIDMYPMVKS